MHKNVLTGTELDEYDYNESLNKTVKIDPDVLAIVNESDDFYDEQSLETFNVMFGDQEIKIYPTDEFKALLLDIQYENGRGKIYIDQLLKTASNFNYYDAMGEDSRAGSILVNTAGTSHHDRILKVSKELMRYDNYKNAYDKVFKDSQDARVARGKRIFGTMIDNAEG